MTTARPKVLVSAYACHPHPVAAHFPGEAILGWSLAREIARFADIHLITWAFNRDGVEGTLRSDDGRPAAVHYVELPPRDPQDAPRPALRRALRLFPVAASGGRVRQRAGRRESFDLFHQITFSNDWMPSFIAPALPVPFVWGPIGGGQKVPGGLMGTLARRERRQERSRTFLQNVWRATPARRRCARKASAILVCNEETRDVLAPWAAKIVGFPVNGIRREDIDGTEPRGRPARRLPSALRRPVRRHQGPDRWRSMPCASSARSPPR